MNNIIYGNHIPVYIYIYIYCSSMFIDLLKITYILGVAQYKYSYRTVTVRTSRQSPLDSDHVLILNTSLTRTDKSFVLVGYLSHSAQIQIFHNISMFVM